MPKPKHVNKHHLQIDSQGQEKLMIYIGIVLTILAADLGIKHSIEKKRTTQQESTILKNTLILRKHHNKGIALNALDRHTTSVKTISVGMTILIAVITFFSCFGRRKNQISAGRKAGLAFVLGGALSNTYDRVFRGYVVDYFSFNVKWQKFRNIIFNIGDLFIFAGSLLMSLCGDKKHPL